MGEGGNMASQFTTMYCMTFKHGFIECILGHWELTTKNDQPVRERVTTSFLIISSTLVVELGHNKSTR